MKKFIYGFLLGIGLMIGVSQAQPVDPTMYQLSLRIGALATDSVRLSAGQIPIGVKILDVTNASTVKLQISFDRVPTVWWNIMELDGTTDYTVTVADTTISGFNPANLLPLLAKKTSDNDGFFWVRAVVNATEAGVIEVDLLTRYF